MVFGDLFTRKSIKCLGKKEKNLITEWLENEGWSFEDFVIFLELVGIKTPVKMLDANLDENTFTCRSIDGKNYKIMLEFGDSVDFFSEIHVTNGIETKGYSCEAKSKSILTPIVNYNSSILKKDNKVLKTLYSEYDYNIKLLINNIYMLTIKFEYSNKISKKLCNIFLEQAEEMENYIFSQNLDLVVSDIYDDIKKILDFKEEDIAIFEQINITFEKNINNEKNILSCIKLNKGIINEYAVIENDETFHIYKDKSWRYFANGIKILYSSETKKYNFSINDYEEILIKAQPVEILTNAKEKISRLWKFIN